MNKTIKRIVALGMGATVLAATAAFAVHATDLSDYPAPFVKNGMFDGKIVIGEKAAAIDTIGALDIAASLQRESASAVAGTAGGETQLDTGMRLDTSGDRIYYGDAFSVDAASGDDLAILKDGQFEDDEGTVYDYTQSVLFKKSQTLAYSQHGESDADGFLGFDLSTTVSATTNFYVAKVDFTSAINTSSADVIGNKITLFGNDYTFSSESTTSKVVLYGSSKEVSLDTKGEVTQTVDGKEYKVKILGFGSSNSKVVVSVNGVSDSVAEGSSKTIGGLKVYAKSVSSWNNGLDGFATLQLGAQKIVLENTQAVATGASEDSVDGTYVTLGGSPVALTSIYVYVNAPDSDNDYIKEGGSFVDPVYGTFAIKYIDNKYGLTDTTRDVISVKPSGSNKVYAKLPVKGGEEKSVYFNYQNALKWDSDKTIYSYENASVAENDYAYFAPADAKYTHLVKVKNVRAHATEGYVEFEDALTGSDYKTEEGEFNSAGDVRTVTVDGKQYKVWMTDATSGSERVSVAYDDAKTVVYPLIELKNGESFGLVANLTGLNMTGTIATPTGDITWANETLQYSGVGTMAYAATRNTVHPTMMGTFKINTSVTTNPALLIKEEEDEANTKNVVLVGTSWDGTNIEVGSVSFSGTASSSVSMSDDDTVSYINLFGTYVTRYNPSGDSDVEVKVSYPQDQMYANVFIAPLTAKATTTSSSGAVALNPIAVGLAILDKDATLKSKPYIVVGGPCANTVAAALMGNGADCAAGFTEGTAMIKLYSDQNALLVAGYSGQDTQGASRVLAYHKDYSDKFTGTELKVVTTNLASLTVSKVQ